MYPTGTSGSSILMVPTCSPVLESLEVIFLPARSTGRIGRRRSCPSWASWRKSSPAAALPGPSRLIPVSCLSEFIFHRNGLPIGDTRKAWRTACKLAGVSGRLFHDLCRTFARNADNDEVSRSVAKDIMGRKTEAIYARYRIVAQGEKVSALLRMQRKSFASQGCVVTIPSVAVQ